MQTRKPELAAWLDAHFATLDPWKAGFLSRVSAGNWQMYAAVTGSALAMATNAAAGSVVYSGTRNLTAGPIRSAGHAGAGGSLTTSAHQSAFLTGAPKGVGFRIGVDQACCGIVT